MENGERRTQNTERRTQNGELITDNCQLITVPYISSSHRGVEQLVARRAHNPKVVGSSPAPATTKPEIDKISGFFVFCRQKCRQKIRWLWREYRA